MQKKIVEHPENLMYRYIKANAELFEENMLYFFVVDVCAEKIITVVKSPKVHYEELGNTDYRTAAEDEEYIAQLLTENGVEFSCIRDARRYPHGSEKRSSLIAMPIGIQKIIKDGKSKPEVFCCEMWYWYNLNNTEIDVHYKPIDVMLAR